MKNKAFVSVTLISAIVLSLAQSLAFSAPEEKADSAKKKGINASGIWKWTSRGRNGETRESSMALFQAGKKLTGKITGGRADSEIENGKIEGNKISFSTSRKTERGSFTSEYSATLDGGKLKGLRKFAFGDRSFEREWDAKREPTDPTGSWNWVLDRGDGQTFEATMKLKMDNHKVTGSLGRDDFQIEIRNGKVEGPVLTFETVYEREGEARRSLNTAVVVGKLMKGTSKRVSDGESRVRNWKATKS
jgi:hypothetical protein